MLCVPVTLPDFIAIDLSSLRGKNGTGKMTSDILEIGEPLLQNEEGSAQDVLGTVEYGEARGLEHTLDRIGFGKSNREDDNTYQH